MGDSDRYSTLNIFPALTNISTIDFIYGKKASEKQKIVENNQYFVPTEFKAAINKLDAIQKAGTKAYKGVDAFVDLAKKITKAVDTEGIGVGVLKPEYLKGPGVSLIENLTKYGPEVAAVLAIVDFLVVGKNAASTTSNTLFSASGDLKSQENFDGLSFYLPGSKYPLGTTATAGIPIYQNILGVFGVLETPEIDRSEEYSMGYNGNGRFKEVNATLKEDIKYVVNPAADLEVEDIKGAVFFTIQVTKLSNFFTDTNRYNINTNLIYTARTETDHHNIDIYHFRTPYLPLGCLKEFKAHFRVDAANSSVPDNKATRFVGTPTFSVLENPTVQLVAKLTTNSNINDYREVNIITRYAVESSDVSVASVGGDSFDDIEINRRVENITLTQDETITAWEHITVGGNINSNGHQLTIISGGSIDLEEFDFNPDIELKIDYPIVCHRVVPQQTEAEIAVFCSNTEKYKPSFPNKALTEELKPKKEGNFSMTVYPNPFSTSTNIEFTLEEEEKVTLRLFNALGVQVESIIEQETLGIGEHKRITRSDLPVGIYFAILQTNNGTQTIKIIKQ